MSDEKSDKNRESTGDTFNFTGADFRGANVNIKSKLSNVIQTINTMPNTVDSPKEELERLIKQLNEALQQVPPEKAEQAEAVAASADLLVKTAAEEKPNKTMIQNLGGMLKNAAQGVAAVMPTVLTIATQIEALILKFIV